MFWKILIDKLFCFILKKVQVDTHWYIGFNITSPYKLKGFLNFQIILSA